MRILKPIVDNKVTNVTANLNNSIFLAGPCPRDDYSQDWRFEAFEYLEKIGFTGTVITPTNDEYHKSTFDGDKLLRQTTWEYETMKRCSALVFWVPRSKERPARTTNIEFGDWYDKEGVYCGFPPDGIHNEYLIKRLEMKGIKYWTDLHELLDYVVDQLQNQPMKKYFTADTHFSQQRTLDLSQRPFVNLFEMDLEMQSNWNKRVRMTDVVYHAGDFGDVSTMKDILSTLNYKELIWVLGNYDRNIKEDIKKIISELPNRKITIVDSVHKMIDDGVSYYIMHEPSGLQDEPFVNLKYPGQIGLYGHIHGRGFAKKSGFDLATDYHQYTPISFDKVKWFANAIRYWDHNVMDKEIKVNPYKVK